MSPWIGNISPDPKLTTMNFLLSSNRVFVDLGEKFTLPLETFISESCTHATEHHYLYRLWAHVQARDQVFVRSVRRFSRLYDRKFCAMDESSNKSIMQFTGAGYKDWKTKMEYGLSQKRLISTVQAWRGKPRLVRPTPITVIISS